MDSRTMLAAVLTAFQVYRAKKAAKGDDSPDAIIETIMPELVKYFESIFKNDAEGFLPALNQVVLLLYQYLGDELQIAVRFMINMNAESLQARHPWMSLPFLVFLKGYFTALEDATKGKPELSFDDIRVATDKVATEAQKAASDLKRKLQAAQQAVKDMHIPTFTSHPDGDDMSDTDDDDHDGRFADDEPTNGGGAASPRPVPAAGGTRTRKKGPGFVARLSGFLGGISAPAAKMVDKLAFFGDRGEDIVQNVASTALWMFILFLVTVVSVGATAGLNDSPEMMAIVLIVNSVLWVVVPLIGFIILRGEAREAAERMRDLETNPYEKAGNGFLEGGGLVLTIAVMGGISAPVIALLCAVGVYHSFAWAYVVTGLVTIALASFFWASSDLAFDAVKALIRAGTPDDREGIELKLKNRLVWNFSRFGLVYCVIMLPAVYIGMMDHTQYTLVGASLPTLFLALSMRFVSIYRNTAPDANQVQSSNGFGLMTLLGMMAPGLVLYGINTFIPPECPDMGKDHKTDHVCEFPSYSERLKAWRLEPAKGSDASSGNGAVQVEASIPDSCSAEVKTLVEQMGSNDCKVILAESKDEQLVGRCKESVSCGALLADGSKKRVVAFRKVTPQDSGIIGELLNSMGCLGISIVAILAVGILAFIGRKDPEAEKKKHK